MNKQILITGATGQVGAALAALYPDALTPKRAELDLADESSIRQYLQQHKPAVILNPAAYTAVDKAESEPTLAGAINTEAPRILGEEAAKLDASLIHFSTDYVFDGTGSRPYNEADATAPTSVYGRTKRDGELALGATGARHVILRTSWVYAATGKNFLQTILRVAAERPEMKIVDDQHGAPTTAGELARLTRHILTTDPELGHAGLYHASGAGETTWHGFASEIIRLAALKNPAKPYATLIPIPTADYPTPARRPENSRLDCSKVATTFGYRMPAWQQSLAETMAEIAPHE
jgi:dTDP-4-dehydrorhamnose reductase